MPHWIQVFIDTYITHSIPDGFLDSLSGKILIAISVFFGIMFFSYIFTHSIIQYIERLAKKTENTIDDKFVEIISNIPFLLYGVIALLSTWMIIRPENVFLHKIVVVSCFSYIAFIGIRVVYSIVELLAFEVFSHGQQDDENSTAVNALLLIVRIILWSGGVILLLSNFGIDVSALIAGVGISGIAVAFALQKILGDLFSSFVIFFDQPFKIGDFISVGNDTGTVKKIGLKTTRITTTQGQELVIANQELTSSRIQNFKKMEKRRGSILIGVEYSTPIVMLKKIPGMIQHVIENTPHASFDRAHLKHFSDYSLQFEVVYYTSPPSYALFMDIQQAIHFGILEIFEKEGIQIAFPTQTLHFSPHDNR